MAEKVLYVRMNGTDDEDLWEENRGENFSPSD
jgi:hypothetical protein